MKGTWTEQLVEIAGRCCYASLGTGRPSGEYHKNLIETQRHFSVAEHCHISVETDLDPIIWFGIPDVSLVKFPNKIRLTFNLRHILEWPHNVTFRDSVTSKAGLIHDWWCVLKEVGSHLLPSVIAPDPDGAVPWSIVEPQTDTEAFVSVFLEDSRVWSHEMVRHRGNISQRSGRFVDETDRPYCIHPLLRDYLNELGHLPDDAPPDVVRQHKRDHPDPIGKGRGDESLFEGRNPDLSEEEIQERVQVGKAVSLAQVQDRLAYDLVVNRLQDYAMKKQGMDKITARKQARSAGRYSLANSLSTEGIFTYSIRHWAKIFAMRCSPHADAAIRELMEKCREIVAGSNYGHLL